MASFDDSDGVTPCVSCKRITPAGELVALVDTPSGPIQTCVDLPCMMRAERALAKGVSPTK